MRILLYLLKCKKHWVSNAFLLYNGIAGRREDDMNSNLKWIIYTVLGISILLILFVAYGVYSYFTF
ncbi:hypothetical protein BtBc_13600 [Bacillus thuringiensis]|nr:hypothetical protein YBT1520_13645 [Bacillus thuringiensis serovar kurstaki str. YBT-1520]AIE33828.1 hypothetical protein BTK_13780 [Bacillus thuringiensis serovar kurstaki str. HD-1]AMX77398.1 hypothetical protein BtBc_13600 [Bacillus thuringiensis]ETE88507.1 hypothetical protein C621_0227615 [Bacillus thuringiensis serovar aizawai str. Leapi01]ETE90555.1 hypothetical protein C623_0230700 [Bacillus thuringiensis serovar aizawai str. Hu4-2]